MPAKIYRHKQATPIIFGALVVTLAMLLRLTNCRFITIMPIIIIYYYYYYKMFGLFYNA